MYLSFVKVQFHFLLQWVVMQIVLRPHDSLKSFRDLLIGPCQWPSMGGLIVSLDRTRGAIPKAICPIDN